MAVGGGGLGFVEAQGEERLGRGTPHAKIVLAGFADKVGSDFDNIGFADLQIEELAQGRLAEGDFDGVQEGTAGPGLSLARNFRRAGFVARGLLRRERRG